MTARTVVDQTLAALRTVALPDEVARTTRDAAEEIDRAWKRLPLVAGLDGNLVARSELINTIVGEPVLDPYRRALGSAPLRVRTGPVLRYRAVRSDDTVVEDKAPELEPRDKDAELEARATDVRGELLMHETGLANVERKLPKVVRKRPAMWMFWLWPLHWLLGLFYRKTIGLWHLAEHLVSEDRLRLRELEGFFTSRAERERTAREQFYGELRLLCGGGPAGKDVRHIELFITKGLPDNVELVELMGEYRASADIDAVIIVERDALYAPTPDGDRVQLGPISETVAELPMLLQRARSLTLARRALAKLFAARAHVEAELGRIEATFQQRMQKLSKLALPIDRTEFRVKQLDRIKPQIVASVHAIMEHASTHMGSELAQLGSSWIQAIAESTAIDGMKAAVARIEKEWPVASKRIADEVRVLVMGGAGGVARDLYVETVSPLRTYGLPEQYVKTPKRAPEVALVPILDALSNPTAFTLDMGGWFSGLFKSFEARRAEIREKVHARVEHIREVAAADILDAEPRVHASVAQALAAQLGAAIELQQSWYQQAVADEQASIAKDREALVPLAKTRDAIVSAGSQLAQLANAIQAERPAVAAAAVAAAV